MLGPIGFVILLIANFILFLFILSFFRNPKRLIPESSENLVYAPADGKVVVIEEANEPEFFGEKKLQISIFMSPLNVHVNRSPLSGNVEYYKYHSGKYLAAWNPKSSTENERCSIVIDAPKGKILVKQIAGALARRIVNYSNIGTKLKQGEEFGFIKFGSRVDIFLPLGTKVNVEMNQMVKGNLDVIAQL